MITAEMIRRMQPVIDAFVKAWVDDDGDEAEALAAALNAWPSNDIEYHYVAPDGAEFSALILPLPQKETDE